MKGNGPEENLKQVRQVTRREFARLAGTFGLTSVLLGLSSLARAGARPPSTAEIAQAASAISTKRSKKQAKHKLIFGGSGFNEVNLKIERQGALFFIADLEDRTDGEIQIEFHGNNTLCGQLNCIQKAQQGIVDIYAASTQNSAAVAPFLNVLDFGYLWPNRASQYNFFYDPRSEKLFRGPLRKKHKIHFLWTHCELRDIQMGLKYKDKPKIMTVEALKGTKLRVTGTQLGRISMQLLGTNPVPLAWEETLDGLKSGLIDGAETWSSAVAYANMTPFISQDVHCQFFSGNEHTAMNLKSFEKLGPALQNAVMESAYLTQVHVQAANEAALLSVVGITDPPLPGTIFEKYGVRNCIWPQSELEKAEHMVSPKHNPKPWEKWRERLNKWAGDIDIFEELYAIAREVPKDMQAIDVDPSRWWKG